ncbi:RHS repeat domain-containing protein [Pseudomonas fungipugnans]|uniref:RHS repeat domain-containing protein n=1 Tax=Pseudomonas fungipugnans TaxID=3024217 RepID=UPI003D70BE78
MLDGEGPHKACPFYYQLDHLGTPQELTDYGGEIVWSARYNAYGKITDLTHGASEQLDQPLRFQGQYFDAESGLHYNRHRYYDPGVGRYLTPDPVKLAGGLNPYRYVPNPTGWVDPLGLSGNCPPPNKSGCSKPDEVGGAVVDEGAPALPKLTGEQRRARIETLKDEVAKRWVERFEDKYPGMHSIGKHGAAVPDAVIRQRAIDGTDPITKKKAKKGNLSSQYKSWSLHMHTLNGDMTRVVRGMAQFTGTDVNGYPIVRRDNENVGRGYKPNKKDSQKPNLLELMHGSETKFSNGENPVPFTSHPVDMK